MAKPVIRAYQAYEWTEIAILGFITVVAVFIIETAFLASSIWISLTTSIPFVTGALAWKRYEYEHTANRLSAAFVGALFGLAAQVTAALILTI